MAAGLRATVTKAQLDQDFGSDIATVRNSLNRFKERYDSYWAPYGASGYLALGGDQASSDELGSAVAETLHLYNILHATEIIASGGAISTGSGHDFLTAMNKVCGTSVS